MLWHPSKHELMAYAEGLVDQQAIPAELARHISGCKSCSEEVAAIRRSLEFADSVPTLEPSAAFTMQLMMAAKKERENQRKARGFARKVYVLTKGLACAAGIVIVASLTFRGALDNGPMVATAPAQERAASSSSVVSPEEISKQAAEIRSLAVAVSARSDLPQSVWERQHRRVVLALDADRAAALAALKRNPGCARASRLVSTNMKREAQALKTLYAERGL